MDRRRVVKSLKSIRGIVLAVLVASVLTPTGAAAIIVPDEAPTIQAGIDSGADEVLPSAFISRNTGDSASWSRM